MDILKLDHIPQSSLAYIVLMFMSVFCGCIASIYDGYWCTRQAQRLFPKFVVLTLILRGIIAMAVPSSLLPSSPDSVKLDDLHIFIGQEIGFIHLTFALILWPAIKSIDPTPRASFIWAFTVGLLIKIVARTYHLTNTPIIPSSHYTEQEICGYSFLFTEIMWVLLSVWYIMKTKSWGGDTSPPSQLNFHLRIESIVPFVFAVIVLALPQWMVRGLTTAGKLDSNHMLFSQIDGANFITYALTAGRAVHYINNADKVPYIRGRLTFIALIIPWLLYNRLTSTIIATPLVNGLLVFVFCLLIHLSAAYATAKFPNFPTYYRSSERSRNE